jgi:hypothetical protein
MTISSRCFLVLASLLLTCYFVPMIVFVASRPPLDADGWAFLEKQRPKTTETANGMETTFFMVADGLNFALARRPIGGWESPPIRLFQLVNLPADLAAHMTFADLEARPAGSSRLHSDIATAVFVATGAIQWLAIALVLSVRGGVSRPAA